MVLQMVVFWVDCIGCCPGITKIEVLPFFQQAVVSGSLSLQLNLDVQQGLVFLVLALRLCPGQGQL